MMKTLPGMKTLVQGLQFWVSVCGHHKPFSRLEDRVCTVVAVLHAVEIGWGMHTASDYTH